MALSKCEMYVDALKGENNALTTLSDDSIEQTDKAVKMAAEQNWGIPAEVWIFVGVGVGIGTGFILGRTLK